MQRTKTQAKAVILAEDTYQLDGVMSIFMDSVDEVIAAIPMSGYPVDEFGDLKEGSFNYTGLASNYEDVTKFCVEKVRTSKLSDRTRNVLANELYVGFIDFDIDGAPAGSTPIIFVFGDNAFTMDDNPEANPPPPTGIKI